MSGNEKNHCVHSGWGCCSLIGVANKLQGSAVAAELFSYRAAVAQFQRDLPLGMPKEDVRNHLDSHNIQYYAARRGESRVVAFEIKIGEDPGGFACEPWIVSVALEFNSADVLKQIHITKSGTCL